MLLSERKVKVAQSSQTLCNLIVHGDSPGKNTEVGCHLIFFLIGESLTNMFLRWLFSTHKDQDFET